MWLMEESHLRELLEKTKNASPTVEQIEAFNAIVVSRGTKNRLITIDGDVATIDVQGVLTVKRDFFAYYYGGGNTTYGEISDALSEIENNDRINSVRMIIDSPGGTVAGLFDTIDDINSFSKPITVVGKNLVASAAFCIACAADTVISNNIATMWGSVGVVATYYVWDSVVNITSTDAPKKRPDVKTEEGQAIVREELDAIHALFVDSIAQGRATTVDNVNASFGQGGLFLADVALERGMIDNVERRSNAENASPNAISTVSTINNNEGNPVDINTLKDQHPHVYQSVFALGQDDGIKQGQLNERDRVTAHLNMGEATGCLDVAIKAVKEGAGMTDTLRSTYMIAGLNQKSKLDRLSDEDEIANATENASTSVSDEQNNESLVVVSKVEKMLGISLV